MPTISQLVREARAGKGYSQSRLATECHWSRSKQAHIEAGRKKPTAEDRTRLEGVLGCRFVNSGGDDSWVREPTA
jgi:ribosome-binding protein aMBF1 (putative translation factor)